MCFILIKEVKEYFCSEALQQINVLVDTMSVLKTSYLEALTVADTFEMQHNIQDVIQQSKQFQWLTKRKVDLWTMAMSFKTSRKENYQ